MGSTRVRKVSAGSSIQCVVCRHTGFDVLPLGHRYMGNVGRRPSKANLLQTRLRDNANGLLRFAGSRRRRGKGTTSRLSCYCLRWPAQFVDVTESGICFALH